MDWERRSFRAGAAALLCAGVLRLSASGVLVSLTHVLADPEVASFFVYLQTGRVVRLSPQAPPVPFSEPSSLSVLPSLPVVLPAVLPSSPPETVSHSTFGLPEFSDADLDSVEITYDCSYDPDILFLLTRPLEWNLHTDKPSVLILHTHTTESYTPVSGDDYVETSAYRTLDPGHNVLCLGELIGNALEDAGIPVLHDTEFHDYPSYNGSYAHACASTEEILTEHPEIQLVLDLHRDAADTPYGQLVTECSIGSETASQLMMVVGTDDGGLENPDWENNLELGLKLHAILERRHPGICRPLHFTYNRYNQHLGGHALLIEIGAAGNTLPEAKLAANALAQAIIELSNGTLSSN